MRSEILLLLLTGVESATWPGWTDTTNVELPEGETCGQAVRYRGLGTQNYICSEKTWVLSEPKATLHEYTSDGTLNTEVAGYHYFNRSAANCPGEGCTRGGEPGWTLGKGCGLESCTTDEEVWTAKEKKKEEPKTNEGTIAWLLVAGEAKDVDGDHLGKAKFLQRLETIGGAPTVGTYPADTSAASWSTDVTSECSVEGELLHVPYQCDYIFSYCGDDAPTERPDYAKKSRHDVKKKGVKLPRGQKEMIGTHGMGTQDYYCHNDGGVYSWKLMQPRAWLHKWVNNKPDQFEKEFVGFHYFATVGSVAGGTKGGGASWSLGDDCSIDTCDGTNHSDYQGRSIEEQADQPNSIPWLLVNKETSSGDLANADYLQRLATVSGKVPAWKMCNSTTVGDTWQQAYECEYVFSGKGGRNGVAGFEVNASGAYLVGPSVLVVLLLQVALLAR